MTKVLPRRLRHFARSEGGAVLTEAILVIPFITLFAAGVLEFGSMLWQRQQMQIGVRDAVRYWTRCRPTFNSCSLTAARNIAFYGNPAGTGALRVPGWDDPSELTITPATPPAAPLPGDLVSATGTMSYVSSPLFGALQIDAITMSYTYSQRYLGW